MRPFVLLLLTACSASMVRSAKPDLSPNAPVNESDRIGVIRYKNSGLFRGKRREDAYRQMRESCGGPYRIVNESETESGALAIATPAGSSVAIAAKPIRYWYIAYECVR